MKKAIAMIVLVALMACMLAACGSNAAPAPAAQPAAEPAAQPAAEPAGLTEVVHLSLGHVGSMEHHYQLTAEKFAAEVAEKTNNMVIIDIYPSEQLGSAAEMVEGVKTGTQDIALIADSNLATYVPLFNVIPMPGLFNGFEGVRTFIESDCARELEASAREQGFEVLGWAGNGFRHIASKIEINSADDIVGVKMRIPNMSFYSDEYTLLETTVVPLAAGDTYSGISTGIADMCEDSPSNLLSKKFYEILDHVAVVGLNFTIEPMIMNSAKLATLPEDVQTIIIEAAKSACAEDIDQTEAQQDSVFAELQELGMTITYPDLDSFRVKVASMATTYGEKYGADFTRLYEEISALQK